MGNASAEVVDVIYAKEAVIGKIQSKAENVAGDYSLEVDNIETNGSANVTISNVAPGGVETATISKWLKILSGGTVYYIPMWT